MTKPEVTSLKPEKGEEDKEKWTKNDNKNAVGLIEMFRFADARDKLYIFLAIICSMANGMSFPMGSLVFAEMVDKFMNSLRLDGFLDSIPQFLHFINLTRQDVLKDPSVFNGSCKIIDILLNTSNSCGLIEFDNPLSHELKEYVYYYVFIGTTVFFASLGQHTLWSVSSERQVNRIRREYLTSILRQDIGWFDTHNVGELNAKLSADIILIQNGIGLKAGSVVQFLSSFASGYLLGFIRGWKLAIVLVCFCPIMICVGGLFNYLIIKIAFKEISAYSRAGAIAEEILGSIRTVVAFGGEEKARARYNSNLGEAYSCGIQKGAIFGGMIGFYALINFSMYSIGMWYGGKLVRDGDLEVNEVLMVFFAVSLGTFAIGIAAPGIQGIAEARGAAYSIFQIIDTKSQIDSSSVEGLRPSSIKGKIQFRDVHFSYPARKGVKVLKGASIDVLPGKAVAIVGCSGCGKSTVMNLLLRFYDPQHGRILLDGIDIKQLNIKYLRRLIGIVSQEPVLFATSIAENIRYGQEGVTTEEIKQAAKNANAYDFISELPDAFNTIVGERGAQLSGGQKQRIAIARALVRDPKILLLDEATSALDNESEAVVQDALDKARQGRTTIIIAHRLSTIRTADIIVGLDQGVVKETGTHEQLMAKRGIYYTLVTNQTLAEEENDLTDDDVVNVKDEKITERKRLLSISEMDGNELEIDDDLPLVSFSQLLRMNTPEWPFLLLGCLSAVVHGSSQPAFAYIFGKILKVLSEKDDDMKDDLEKYCLFLFLIGVGTFLGAFIQSFVFGFAGEALTERLRSQTFRAMLYQEIGWYDKPYNSTGALTSRLAKDASLVQGATGTKLGVLVQCFVAIAVAIIMALIYGWQVTLVTVSFFPLLLAGGIIQTRLLSGHLGLAKEASENAAKVAVEILENVRTIASLSKEQEFIDRYMHSFEVLTETSHKRSVVFGLFLGMSSGAIQFSMAVIFAYGGYLVDRDDMHAEDVLNVFNYIVFCGIYLGQAAGFTPDIAKATAAARRIFYVLRRKSEVNAESTLGDRPEKGTFHSTIEFSNTKFSYPCRPEVTVLQKFNITVKPGQTVALVGCSGCGKSTCVALLERFYDVEGGSVSVGGKNVEDLNIRWLRSQIGLVSQEPVLFDCSIAENIAYGDNARQINMEEIVRAAQKANIHNFITALPQGYNTNVGDKGTQLSGGQKQRIAIARALVRDPKILLLDEATSSLDAENETMVQEALDKARKGRTSIAIAHRLSTIQDADKIVVLRHGKMIEEGTHENLMALKGAYYRLQKAQNKA